MKKKLRPWILPILIFLILIVISFVTTEFHSHSEEYHQSEKASQITNAISKSMSREIEHRLQALKIFSSGIHAPPTDKELEDGAKFLRSEYSGFFAINFVTPEGYISKVFPYEENKAALGQNLFERNDVNKYLFESKADGQPRASHRISTYQGIYAIVLYVPVYNKAKKFLGWMNGVLSIDHCLSDYMKDKKLENASARVRWHYPAVTNTLTYNWNMPTKYYTSTFVIMNQTLSIDLALAKTKADRDRDLVLYFTIALRILLIVIVTTLVTLLTLSKLKLQKSVTQLCLKNNLLSSLSHDLATPMTSLKILIDQASQNGELNVSKDSIYCELEAMEQMTKSVRFLHGYDTGVSAIPLEGVGLYKAINDALKLVEPLARKKQIKFEITHFEREIFVKANAQALVNNVLLNAFSNAIKFSPTEGAIKVSYSLVHAKVTLTIADEGKGLAAKEIETFNRTASIGTTAGSAGETGTGLGLLQISSFMKIFEGEVIFEQNKPTGTKLLLTFKKD